VPRRIVDVESSKPIHRRRTAVRVVAVAVLIVLAGLLWWGMHQGNSGLRRATAPVASPAGY
jgi:cytoskeletal protein RodZ